jgi:signal transduction histidine kinase
VPVQPTMVPYLWRRHLGFLRAFLAFFALALYLAQPVPNGWIISFVLGLFFIYTVWVLTRDQIESRVYHLPALLLDLVFLFLCALHPSPGGLWLTTVCYFYLMCTASLMYDYRNVIGIVATSVSFFVIFQPKPSVALWPTVLLVGVFATVFSMQREHFQYRLSAALRRSVLARMEAERARENERQRIAADFHDGPLQSFISFQMRLEIVRKLLSRDLDAAIRELIELQDLGKAQVSELRLFVRNMQPVEIDQAGLAASIREVVANFERDSGIPTNLVCSDLPDIASTEFATEILQIIREALNNIRKHSRASRVEVIIDANHKTIDLEIHDDGSGFPFSGTFSLEELELLRLGPKSIKRRVRTLGGEMTLDSKPSEGSDLRVRIPV